METLNEYCHLHLLQFLSPRDKLIFATVCPEWKKIMDNFFGISKLIMQSEKTGASADLETGIFLRIIRVLGSSLEEIHIQDSLYDTRPHIFVHFDTHAFHIIIPRFSIVLKSLSKYCKNLSNLKIGNFRWDYDRNKVKNLFNCSKTLKQLEIVSGELDSFFKLDIKIVELPRSIEHRVLENVCLKLENDQESCLDPMKLPNLKSLTVKGKLEWTYNFIQKLPEIAEQLKVLEITEKSLDSQRNFRQLTNISKLINLEKLVFKDVGDLITDKDIFAIALNCDKLLDIVLDQCLRLSDQSVNVLLSSLPELRCLKLRRLDALKNIHPEKIAWNMKSLIVQSCDKLFNLKNAISMMPNLEYLKIIDCFPFFSQILPIIKVLVLRTQNLELIQRINFTNAQKIVFRMKNSVSLPDAEAYSSDNVQTFKLVWIYTPIVPLDASLLDSGIDPYLSFCLSPSLNRGYRFDSRECFLEYQATQKRIKEVIKKIPTHEVLFEMEKTRDEYL